jgi:hypothetical protein
MKFNLRKYSQVAQVELDGTLLSVYHRTDANAVANLICETGFLAGGGAAWGVGIYSNYMWSGVTRNQAMGTYGAIAVKGKMNISDFLIFDYAISKQVYGSEYRLINQIKRLGLDRSMYRDQMGLIESISKDLESKTGMSNTSDLFRKIYNSSLPKALKGVLFSGHVDKSVALAYDSSVVYPVGFTILDQRTVNNPKWTQCSAVSIESSKLLYDAYNANDSKAVDAQRDKLFRSLSDNNLKEKLSYESLNLIPTKFVDNVVSMTLIKNNNDKSTLERLEGSLKEKMSNPSYINFEMVKRQFFASPVKYWETLKAHPFFKGVSNESISKAFQSYIEQNPFDWDNLPDEIKNRINKKPLTDYFSAILISNKRNLKNVPADFVEILKSENKISKNDVSYYEHSKSEYITSEFISEEIEVPLVAVGWLQNGIDKLNNKGFKLGLPPSKIEVVSENIALGTKKIRVIKSIPIIPGNWELVAKINVFKNDMGKLESDTFNLGRRVIPDKYIESPDNLNCELCHKEIYRREYYLLYSKDNNVYKCVGSSCLSDLLPGLGTDAVKIAQYAAEMEKYIQQFKEQIKGQKRSGSDISTSYRKSGIPIPFFLSRVYEIAKTGDYISRKNAREQGLESTADKAYNKCFDDLSQDNLSLTISDLPFVNAVIDWIQTLSTSSNDFLKNLYDASVSGFATRRNMGLLASAIPSYYRSLKNSEIALDNDKRLGEKGSSLSFEGEIIEKMPVFVRASKNGYSTNDYFFVAKDSADRKILFSGSSDDFPVFSTWDKGSIVKINSVIEGFLSYDGDSCTVVNVKSILEQIDKNVIEEQEKKINELKDSIKTPIVYQDGMTVDSDYKVESYKQTRNDSYFVQVSDETGQKLSLFLNVVPKFNIGDTIHISGTIKLNNGFKNIMSPVISFAGQSIKAIDQVYKMGERITIDCKVIDIFDAYVSFNDSYIQKAKVEDSNGFTFEFNMPSKSNDFEIGDSLNVTGKLEGVYGVSGKLTRPKVNSIVKNYSNVPTDNFRMIFNSTMNQNDKNTILNLFKSIDALSPSHFTSMEDFLNTQKDINLDGIISYLQNHPTRIEPDNRLQVQQLCNQIIDILNKYKPVKLATFNLKKYRLAKNNENI